MTVVAKSRRGRHEALYLITWFLLGAAVVLAATGVVAYLTLSADLPPLYSLRTYRPLTVTEIYSDNGTLIAEFAEQQRKVVPINQIPDSVQKAFVASEDRRFYQHKGVDFFGLARVIFQKIIHLDPDAGGGASTITQQVARSFFLSPERTFTRKFKEQILALQMERYLTKAEILNLYLNQIDLGRGVYGVGAAAEYYFGKPVQQLNLAEAAMLAGFTPRPARWNPVSDFRQARFRQINHVLKWMADPDVRFITEKQRAEAEAYPIKIAGKSGADGSAASYFVEHVRRLLVQRYGWNTVYREGLKVFTTVNLDATRQATAAAAEHIMSFHGGIDKTLGYHGPLPEGPLHGDTAARVLDEDEARFRKDWLRARWREVLGKGVAEKVTFAELEKAAPNPIPLDAGRTYRAWVEKVDDKNYTVIARVGRSRVTLTKAGLGWAAPYVEGRAGAVLRRPSDILKAGDLILVKVDKDKEGKPLFRLDQHPAIQAGVFAMNSRTGYVKALVGGQSGEYIRPIQAVRQPGSAFKPIMYAAAMDADPPGRYTPATVVTDTALIIDDKSVNACGERQVQRYAPGNYDNGFTGARTIRDALSHSINTIAVKVSWDICESYVVSYAHRLGISSKLYAYPCLPLGCNAVTLEEMVTAFNVFDAGGFLVDPVYILRVYDRDGNLLEYEEPMPDVIYDPQIASWAEGAVPGSTVLTADSVSGMIEEDLGATPVGPTGRKPRHFFLARLVGDTLVYERGPISPLQLKVEGWEDFLADIRARHGWIDSVATPIHGDPIISAPTAYLVTSMMQSVITNGTARAAMRLGRPLAGKTGTTNDYKDAWFIGYSPELIAGVWVGADDYNIALGRGMAGGRVALPVWIKFMEQALANRPKMEFPVPPGIVTARVCNTSGLLASDGCGSTHSEIFKEDAKPKFCNHSAYYTPTSNSVDPATALDQLE